MATISATVHGEVPNNNHHSEGHIVTKSPQEQRLCTECGEPQSLTRKAVPYPQSGLSNVLLENVPVWRCPNFHEEVEIPSPQNLHDVLAFLIIRKPAPLVGAEVRFLRRRIKMSAKEFAGHIGLSAVRQSQIENSKNAIGRRTDLLVRLSTAAVLASRQSQPFPFDLAPLVTELENCAWDLGEHRIRHNDNAAPDKEWVEASAAVHS